MDVLDKIVRVLNKVLICIAGLILVAMITMTCANIFLRIVWVPVKGTFELMGYGGAVVMAFALGMTQVKRGHIAVDILVQRFPKSTQRILTGINCIVCTLFFAVVSWQIAKYATTLLKTGEVTETLRIIYYPFTYGVALGCAILSLVFFTDLLKTFFQKVEDSE
jgi:TRAP-type C4-dicarboxylate transport system permease small subunit